jgi:acyl carrier protein
MDSQSIQQFVVSKLSELKNLPADHIDVNTSVFQLGLDSSGALELVGYLEDYLGTILDPAIFWEFPEIRRLADHLAETQSL